MDRSCPAVRREGDLLNAAMPVLPSHRRLLTVVIDGLCGETLDALIALPGMRRLAALAATAQRWRLRCPRPRSPATLLATLHSGMAVAKHGVLDEYYLDRARRAVVSRSLPPFVAERPRPVPATRADWMVGAWQAPTMAGRIAGDSGGASVGHLSDCDSGFAAWRETHTDFAQMSADVERTRLAMRRTVEAAQRQLREPDWRWFHLRITALGRMLQRTWHQLALGDRPGAKRNWVARLHDALAAFDEAIGNLADLAARSDAGLMIVGPFGLEDGRPRVTVNQLLRDRGLLVGATGASAVGYRWRRLLWKGGRTFRRWCFASATGGAARPVDAEVAFDPRTSAAFTLHGHDAALVYLNSPERFGRGPIERDDLREVALAEADATLSEARDPSTGQRLFTEVYRVDERFGVNPIECDLPEVVGIPAPGYQVRHRLDRKGRVLRAERVPLPARKAEGLLLMPDTGRGAGTADVADLADVASATLQCLGVGAGGNHAGFQSRQ